MTKVIAVKPRSIESADISSVASSAESDHHPMAKFQRKVRSLVETKAIKPTDSLWKIAFIFGDKWPHWKAELESFDFSMQDAIAELLAVETWEEEEDAAVA